MATQETNIQIVQDIDTARAGALIMWDLDANKKIGAVRIAHRRLADVWISNGLDPAHLPAVPSPSAVLYRVLMDLYTDRSTLVRPVESKNGRAAYAVLPKTKTSDAKLQFTQAWSVEVEVPQSGDPILHFNDASSVVQGDVQEFFELGLGILSSKEISAWLVDTAQRLRATSIKSNGGTYFLLPDAAQEWYRIADVLENVTSKVALYAIPAVRSDRAVKTVLASIKSEAELVEAEIAAEMEKWDDSTRSSTKQSRVERTKAMSQKLKDFGSFLGVELTELNKRLEKLNQRIVESVMSSDDDF